MTGEVPAGFSCHFSPVGATTVDPAAAEATSVDLGSATLGSAVPVARGWTVAGWLVGHAQQYRIASVAFQGQRWTPTAGGWRAGPPAGAGGRVSPPPARSATGA